MPEQETTTESTLETAAPDLQAEAVAALGAWIALGEARLAALSPVPGNRHLGMARGAFECALAVLRNDLALIGGKH